MPPSKELLDKFYRNQCSSKEYQQVLEWLQDPANEEQAETLMLSRWEGLRRESVRQEPDGHQLFNQIEATLNSQAQTRTRPLYQRMYRIAAAFALLLAAGALVGLYVLQSGYHTEKTAFGETRRITLPDGSVVHLNGNSAVKYADNWPDNQRREVWLEGEAYFSVRHTRSRQPFVVHTENPLSVEVLGTEFNVYSRENGAKVVLERGKVRLNLEDNGGKADQQVVMKPGELVVLTAKAAHYEKKVVNTALYSSWRQNKLQLNNTSLAEVITVLRETHGLDIRVKDAALLQHRASGTIPTADREVLLAVMADVFEMDVRQQSGYIECNPLL